MSAHVGDIGFQIIFDTGEDLAGATVHNLIFLKPGGSIVTFSGTIDGTTLKYTTTAATDLDIMGTWSVQAYVEMSGWKGHSGVDNFQVLGNLG
jgi:hypothetical protein